MTRSKTGKMSEKRIVNRKPTLGEFIEQSLARGANLFPKNAWVTCYGFKALYVRIGPRVLDGVKRSPCLDLATIEASKPGAGRFTALVKKLQLEYPHLTLYVENVLTERFAAHLMKEWIVIPNEMSPSFYMLPKEN